LFPIKNVFCHSVVAELLTEIVKISGSDYCSNSIVVTEVRSITALEDGVFRKIVLRGPEVFFIHCCQITQKRPPKMSIAVKNWRP
jgi:hypothetical protein